VALIDGGARRLRLRIDPGGSSVRTSDLLLVVIDDAIEGEVLRAAGDAQMLDQVRKLEAELKAVHAQLTVLSRNPQPASPEGLRHESEEQMRAAVEELESAREELQAVNEELISVNHENRYRIDTLAELSNDLQHLLESTGFAMVLLDRELRVVRFTPRAAALLRLEDSDIGHPLTDLKPHLQYGALVADLRKVAEELTELETEAGSDDGRWYLVHAQPYRTARRGLEGISLLFVDITDRKRAELALQESDRRKEEFLAILAHELRNPLAPIIAGLEVLGKNPKDRALVQRVTATMARQSKQLVMLVDDLLEVVRINEDKLTLRLQAVSIAEVVRDAVSATRPVMESLEHQLTIEVPAQRLTVKGDGTRLTQVIGNLLNNAARYTPPRGKIALCVRRDEEQVLISVEDNGRGLSAQSLKNVFEMFYQAGESGVSNAGLGIGLTLAKKLVEMHGGIIRVESAGAGMGSTFTVRLPLAQGEVAATTREAQDEVSESARRHRVLIVDDNTDAAETLRLLMKSLGGGEVRTASNGPDALEAAATLHPDVVLLDLSMPGMDGYELARRIRAESWGKRAFLVALTGWGQDQHRRRSHEAGFDRHMIKPADAEALRGVLNSC
jgi:two-component system CheB/CheR fusion protein